MKNIINKYKKQIILGLIYIGIIILLSILYLISNISYKSIAVSLIILNLLFILLLSYKYSLGKNKKGIYLGTKFGLIIISILTIINIIFKSFKLNTLIYYLLILLSSIFGSILAKNKK